MKLKPMRDPLKPMRSFRDKWAHSSRAEAYARGMAQQDSRIAREPYYDGWLAGYEAALRDVRKAARARRVV